MAENYEIIKGFQTKQGLGLYDYDSLHNKPGLATQEKAGLLSPQDKVRIEQIEEIKQAVDEIDYPVDSVNGKTGQVELTKDDIGLNKVENKTSEEIRNEITKENVTGALGYTPLTADEVNKAVQGANNAAQAAQATANQAVGLAQNAQTTANNADNKAQAAQTTAEEALQGVATALPISGGRMTGSIDMNNNSLIGLAQPQKDNDAATKTYVDKLVKNIDLSNYPTKTELEEMISGFSGFVAQDEPPENIDALWIDTDDESSEEAGSNIELDDSLTIEGMAADAKAVGDAIADVVYSGEAAGEAATAPLNADTLGGKLPSDYAPAGYGLGEMNGASCSDCNTAIQVGFYTMVGSSAINTPSEIYAFKWGSLVVDASTSAVFQTIKSAYATAYRVGNKSGGVVEWGEWEYDNHPMDVGVEYRTTERWNGKPVYTMMSNIGALPNNTGKTTEGGPLPMGITPISAYGIGLNGKMGAVIPSRHIYLSVYGEWGTVYVNTDSDYSNYTGYIIVKYVKD